MGLCILGSTLSSPYVGKYYFPFTVARAVAYRNLFRKVFDGLQSATQLPY